MVHTAYCTLFFINPFTQIIPAKKYRTHKTFSVGLSDEYVLYVRHYF